MRLRDFFLTEMARPRGEAMWAVLDWAAQQKGTFTMRDLYNVYLQNGGRGEALGDNIQSFSTGMMKHIAQPGKVKIDRKTGQSKHPPGHYDLSQKRPILQVHRGAQGGGLSSKFRWGLDKPLRDPGVARFVDIEEPSAGDAMDNIEAEIGPERLRAAMAHWKKMGHTDKAVADIKASIPKKLWMDAMHILMDIGGGAESDAEAEDELDSVSAAPQDDEEEDQGEFIDAPPEPFNPDDYPDEEEPVEPSADEEEPETAPEEPEETEPDEDEDEIEEPTRHQAGAANFIKPQAPAPSPPAKKSSIGALMKKFRK